MLDWGRAGVPYIRKEYKYNVTRKAYTHHTKYMTYEKNSLRLLSIHLLLL